MMAGKWLLLLLLKMAFPLPAEGEAPETGSKPKNAPAATMTPEQLVEASSRRLAEFMRLVEGARFKEEKDCEKLIHRIERWIDRVEPEMKRLKRAFDRLPPAQKARATRHGEKITARLIARYTPAVIAFDQCCSRYSHQLEELLSRLLLGSCSHADHDHADGEDRPADCGCKNRPPPPPEKPQ